jgi:hypothetical protein
MSAEKYLDSLKGEKRHFAQAYLDYLRGEGPHPRGYFFEVVLALQQICGGS